MGPISATPSDGILEGLFPFHVRFDGDFRILSLGASLSRLAGDSVLVGHRLTQFFEIERPHLEQLDLEEVGRNAKRLAILAAKFRPLRLRGQFLVDRAGTGFFLGTPVLQSLAELRDMGLRLNDFALHDAIGDLLVLMQTRETVIRDMRQALDQLEISEQRFRQLVHGLGDGMALVDARGKIVFANPSLGRMLDLPPDLCVGQDFADFVAPSDVAVWRRLLEESESAADSRVELTALPRGGGELRIAIEGRPHHNTLGAERRTVLLVRDLTREREAEAERRRRIEAEARDRAKSTFMAHITHEIRTPASAILGLVGLLQNTSLDPHQTSYLDKVDTTARHLLGLLSTVFDLSRIEAEHLPIERVSIDLEELVRTCTDLIGPRCAARGLEFCVEVERDVPARIQADPLRLRQILINFLENAVKFTREGEVLLRLSRPPVADGAMPPLRFEVIDTGIGFDNAQAARLFQSFEQENETIGREFGGAGLGLAISDRLANLMGGSTGAHGVPGGGARFWVDLPVDESSSTRWRRSEPLLAGRKVRLEIPPGRVRQVALGLLADLGADPEVDGLGRPVEFVLSQEGGGRPGVMPTLVLRTYPGTPSPGAGEVLLPLPLLPGTLRHAVAQGADPMDPPPAEQDRAEKLPPGSPIRVLLVEDNQMLREIMVELLEYAGAQVSVATHGQEAIRRLSEVPIDLLLMDLFMPVKDGLTATREIRAGSIQADVPIVALTAHALEEERRKCLEAGMNDFLLKPVDPAALRSILKRWSPER